MARAEAERARAEEDARKADDERRRLEAERRVLEEAVQGAEAERQKAVEEHKLRIRKKEEAEREREAAEKAATEARAEQKEAERMLREGAHPVVVPTNEQFLEAKRRLQYQEGYAHVAVTGVAGSGKSSLINALRGLSNGAPGAAPTGIMETTKAITRYPDPGSGKRVVWYDVPGAGTLTVPDWVYFTDQGLYVLDCILVLIDARFTATDVAILRNCARFRIPAYIVRSKARQNIHNLAQDMSDEDTDEEAEGDASTTAAALERAAERYVAESQKSVAHNLQLAELPQQRVYLVDKETLVQLVKGRRPKTTLDENDLLRDMTAATTTSSEERADG
ncbi:P-loop containing nucleoside triphosphate hydrolase protein [Daedalea quercina L-15889]|uniref:p-loop containing nucleoside triphosphate hydrolase protein n=1 Tax=Daedalea quercina L-15889 TaxID=1314783 RepID=A0A165QST1_9APHY|nr:P-loop containing nucleoside triphosphate hydrolase protein [Daedalea quercina L-15889]